MDSLKPKQVGTISQSIIELLNLNAKPQAPVLIGQANIEHMKAKHGRDYLKYGGMIGSIVAAPDYVGLNQKDDSIELVKEFQIDGDFVKVAVRATNNGVFFVRSLYVLNPNRVVKDGVRGKVINAEEELI